MNLKLVKLSREYKRHLEEMLPEWIKDIEENDTPDSPDVIFKNDYRDFDYYLNNLETNKEDPNDVPDSVFFCLDQDTDKFVGAVNLRHTLSEDLLHHGGHIGIGIRPSERQQGYASEMVSLSLAECRKLGIYRVLMTCDKDNVGSAKTIQNNGGVLDNEFTNEEGIIEQRYWIDLK